MNYSKDIAAALREFFGEMDWFAPFDSECGIFRFGVGLESKIKKVDCYAVVKKSSYRIYAFSPMEVDLKNTALASLVNEFLLRANYNSISSNFEIDLETGLIRAKCFVNCEGLQAPTKEMLASSVFYPAILFEYYGAGLIAIMNGMSAKDAVEMCDNNSTLNIMLHTLEPPNVKTNLDIIEESYQVYCEGSKYNSARIHHVKI